MSERDKEVKRVGELVRMELKTSSLEEKLIPIHRQILEARATEKTDLTAEEFAEIVLEICVMYLIAKDKEPDMTTMDLCEMTWHRKYKHTMNKQELKLAFLLNITGDLGEKKITLTNFQYFSLDFFSDVLNAYLNKRNATYKQQQDELKKLEVGKVLPPYDPSIQVLEQIILDFKMYHAIERELHVNDIDFAAHVRFPVQTKLEYVNRMYEIKTNEKHFIVLRELAAKAVLRNLAKKRNDLRAEAGKSISKADGEIDSETPLVNFGAITTILHQIARIQAGKLIVEADERLIQQEVRRLLYLEALFEHKPNYEQNETLNDCMFVSHVMEHIERFKKI